MKAALSPSWSNGPLEGNANRLKMLERQRYDRVGVDLLRARVLRATAKRLEAPRYEVAAALEQAALAELRERRPDRAIETNVEFWAAVILDFAQVPTKMMPAMFTCGRTAGWCAHILEQKRLGKLVRPAAIYVGPGPRGPEAVEGWDLVAKS